MPKASPIITNFTTGEISPRLEGRVDVKQYFNGAKTLKNALIEPYGGGKNRPGSYYVAEVKDSSKATRIISFEFSTTQAYIIEMGDQYMRFYKDNGQIIVTASDISDFDPTASYTPAGDFVKVGDYIDLDCGSSKFLYVNAPYGTDTSGKTVEVEIAGGDVLAVTYTAGAIKISLANATPAKNSADLIQTALRASNAAVDDWYVTENAAYAAARPTAGVTLSATALTACDQIYYCAAAVTGNATNTSLFPPIETSYWTNQTAYEIDTPYLEAELFDIQFAQSADILYITHNNHAPRKLTRTAHIAWTLTAIDYTATANRAPMLPDNITATTITPEADTGSDKTLTASTAIFTADHVGSIWRIKDGYAEIITFTDTTHVQCNVLYSGDLNTGPGAVTDWAEGAWSDERGYPASITFYEQRLAFGGSTYEPQTTWLSKNNEFENMLVGANDDDALAFTIATEQVNAIQWLNAGKVLAIGTSGGEFKLWSGSVDAPLTPTNLNIKRETSFGSKKIIPKRIGNFVYYVQRYGLKLREMGYDFDSDSYRSIDMTILSDHITESGIVDMAYQQNPTDILWCVRTDGTIATFIREIDQQVKAWARQVTDGYYESVAAIPLPASDYDEVWTVVKRAIDGSDVRYIEYFKTPNFDDQEDAFFVDSGLSLDSPKTITDIVGKTALDNMEYASDIIAQAAYASGDAGVDPNTHLLIHCDGNDGSQDFTDEIGTHTITAGGTAQVNIVNKKFGSGGLKLDGNSDFLSAPDSNDWNICGSTADDWVIDLWVKHTDHAGFETYVTHYGGAPAPPDFWRLVHSHGDGVNFQVFDAGAQVIDTGYGGEITDSNWHHIAICKKGADYGVYVDGVQVTYAQEPAKTPTFGGLLYVGMGRPGNDYFSGYMDEIRIQHNDYFGASPNAGKTDTITIPTRPYGPNLQCYSESTITQQGSYSLKVIAEKANSLNDALTRTVSPTIDLTGKDTVRFSIRASRTGSNIKIGFHDSGGTTTEKTITIAAADTWETVDVDFSGVADADKDVIDQIIITIVNADAENIFYIDNIHTSGEMATVTTAVAHGFSDGDRVVIRNVVGMTEVNGVYFKVANKTALTFEITDLDDVAIDMTEYAAYVSNGEVRKCANSVGNLTHLEGKEIAVFADGQVHANKVVASGSITLDDYYGQVHAGLPYESIIQTLRLEAGSAIGTAQMKTKRIFRIGIRFYRTLGAQFGPDEDNLDDINFRDASIDLGERTPLFTGDKILEFPSGFDRNAYITIKQTQPLPLYVICIVPWLEVSDE